MLARAPTRLRARGCCADVLGSAIQQGAPMYNRGDIRGCAGLYRQAAEAALRLPSTSEGERMRLRAGLQGAGGGASDQDAAWALRRAFDDVLAGNVGKQSVFSSGAPARGGSAPTDAVRAGRLRCFHTTQIVMGLVSAGLSFSFLPSITEGGPDDGCGKDYKTLGCSRPMRTLEYTYALLFFAVGVPLGLTTAAAGALYFRGCGRGPVVAASLAATLLILGDLIVTAIRTASHLDVTDILVIAWLIPMGLNRSLLAAHQRCRHAYTPRRTPAYTQRRIHSYTP